MRDPVLFEVYAHPHAKVSRVELRDGACHVYVAALAHDGEANEAIVKLLAQQLRVAPSSIVLVRGRMSRRKAIAIAGLSKSDIERRLAP